MLTQAEVDFYLTKGYVFVPSLFSSVEIDRLRSAAKSDQELDVHAFDRNDGEG